MKKAILCILIFSSINLVSQDTLVQHRIPYGGSPPLFVEAVSNADGWTATASIGPVSRSFHLIDPDWQEVSQKVMAADTERHSNTHAINLITVKNDSLIGFLEIYKKEPVSLFLFNTRTQEFTTHSVPIFPDTTMLENTMFVGLSVEQGIVNILWIEFPEKKKLKNQSPRIIQQSSIDLLGNVHYAHFSPHDPEEGSEELLPESAWYGTYLGREEILPGSPRGGWTSRKLVRRGNTIWLLADNFAGRDTKQAASEYITIIDLQNKTYRSFFLPYSGVSTLHNDSLFIYRSFYNYTGSHFQLHVIALADISQYESEVKSAYTIVTNSEDQHLFPIKSKRIRSFKNQKGRFELSRHFHNQTSFGVIGHLRSPNANPFITVGQSSDSSLHIRLGYYKLDRGSYFPKPRVPISAFFKTRVKEVRMMDFFWNPSQDSFLTISNPPTTVWDRYNTNTHDMRYKDHQYGYCFQHPAGWYVAYYNQRSKSIIFRQL